MFMKTKLAAFGLVAWALLGGCASSERPVRIPAQTAASSTFPTAEPLRDSSKLVSAVKEAMYPLTQARVVIADYPLLRRDFQELANLSEPEIDSWLLARTAYISKGQAAQVEVNTPIPHDHTREIIAFRPGQYGRASVASEGSNLIDVKGTGALKPRQASHGNGLVTLGEGFREFIYENVVRDGLRDAGSSVKTVGSYAVIDAGFDVVHGDGSRSRAGLYLRQASVRDNLGFADGTDVMKVRQILSTLGIETEGNIQMSRERALVDFGHYAVSPKLQGQQRDLGRGAKLLPLNVWGYDERLPIPAELWSLSRWDYPWAWSHEFAEAWGRGEVDRATAWRHFMTFKQSYSGFLNVPVAGGSCTGAVGDLLRSP
jgi:hypothetical protein